MPTRALRRTLLGVAAAVALVAVPAAAGAHVEAEGETADGVTTVTFSFHHGCDGNPTTSLRVQLPEGATDVVPQDPPGWTSTVADGELRWTGGEVPDAEEGTFVVSMTLAEPEGTTVVLPTVQGCTNGTEEAWIDRSDDPEAAQAAPRVTAGPAVVVADPRSGDGDGGVAPTTAAERTTNAEGTTSTTAAPAETQAATATTAASGSSSSAPLIVAALAGVVVVAGIVAFAVSRRRGDPPSS